MHYLLLIYNHCKSIQRSILSTRNILANIFIAISLLYIGILLFEGSYVLRDYILAEEYDLNSLIVKYIVIIGLADFFMKIFFLNISNINITPYLRLDIQRELLSNFIIIKSQFHIVNIVSFISLIPITVVGAHAFSCPDLFIIVCFILSIFACNSYFAFLLKLFFTSKIIINFALLVFVILLYFLREFIFDKLCKYLFSLISIKIYMLLIIALILLIAIVYMHIIACRKIKNQLYQ